METTERSSLGLFSGSRGWPSLSSTRVFSAVNRRLSMFNDSASTGTKYTSNGDQSFLHQTRSDLTGLFFLASSITATLSPLLMLLPYRSFHTNPREMQPAVKSIGHPRSYT